MSTYFTGFFPDEASTGAKGSAAFLTPFNSATVFLYQRATSAPSAPNGNVIYTYETGAINLTAVTNGWLSTIPSGAAPLYVTTALAYSEGATATLVTADWKTPSILAESGTSGDPGLSAYLTNESVSLFTYADGTVVSFSTANGKLQVFSGVDDVTASVTSLTATGTGCTGTINTANNTPINGQPKGYYQVTAMSADTATLLISGLYEGTVITKVFSLTKNKAGYEIVGTLPVANLFEGRTVYLTTDDKLYRYTGTAWTSAVPTTDLTGTVEYQQIGNGAVRVQHLLVQPNNLNLDFQFRDTTLWTQDNESGTAGDGPISTATTGWYAEETTSPLNVVRGYRYLALWSGRSGMDNSARYTVTGRVDLNNVFRPMPDATYELKASVDNQCNQWILVGIRWLNSAQAVIDFDLIFWNPTESSSKTLQVTPPLNAMYGIIVVANQGVTAGGGPTLSGTATVTNVSVRDTAGSSMIVDGSIIANKIFAGAVTTDKLDAGAVTAAKLSTGELITLSAQIKDGIISTAKIGDAQIKTAKIDDLQVSTIKIANQAVTIPNSAYTSGSITASNTVSGQITLQSMSITTTGAPVYIAFSTQFALTTSASPFIYIGRVKVFMGATEIYSSALIPFPNGQSPQYSFNLSNTPSAGTYTVSVVLITETINGAIGTASNRSLFTIETKK